jgi:hypothetical protein
MSMLHAVADSQPEQAEQTGQGVVGVAGRLPLGDEGAEFHAVKAQAEGGGLGVDLGSADILGWGVLENADDGEAVEAGDGGDAPFDGRAGQASSNAVVVDSDMADL